MTTTLAGFFFSALHLNHVITLSFLIKTPGFPHPSKMLSCAPPIAILRTQIKVFVLFQVSSQGERPEDFPRLPTKCGGGGHKLFCKASPTRGPETCTAGSERCYDPTGKLRLREGRPEPRVPIEEPVCRSLRRTPQRLSRL